MPLTDAFALIAAAGFLVGGVVGFFIGVDAAVSLMAARWLEVHPEDGDVRIRPGRDGTIGQL